MNPYQKGDLPSQKVIVTLVGRFLLEHKEIELTGAEEESFEFSGRYTDVLVNSQDTGYMTALYQSLEDVPAIDDMSDIDNFAIWRTLFLMVEYKKITPLELIDYI